MKKTFGKLADGREARLYAVENGRLRAQITDYGASLVSLYVDGVDVCLGCDDVSGYECNGSYLGAVVGRNANRIGKGRFVLNGVEYQLDQNNGGNNLHSGLDFQSFRIWKVKAIEGNAITFSIHSPDGDQGFPGALDLDVTYTLTDDNAVRIDYYGIPQADTIINYTNHSYFNLNGHASGPILKHTVWMDADYYTPTAADSVPTGEIAPVEGTPMDFRTKKEVGRDIGQEFQALIFGNGYDHNWCLNNNGKLAKVAELTADVTGLTLEVYTDLPGVQIYTANFVNNELGKGGVVYNQRHGICFETQYYPDTPNHPNFPSSICRAGEVYRTTTVYKFL